MSTTPSMGTMLSPSLMSEKLTDRRNTCLSFLFTLDEAGSERIQIISWPHPWCLWTSHDFPNVFSQKGTVGLDGINSKGPTGVILTQLCFHKSTFFFNILDDMVIIYFDLCCNIYFYWVEFLMNSIFNVFTSLWKINQNIKLGEKLEESYVDPTVSVHILLTRENDDP